MSHQGFDSTFKEFKTNFYSKVGNASAFDVLDINLLKVVLDGLKVQYNKRGKITHYFDQPMFVTRVVLLMKRIKDFKKRATLATKLRKVKDASFLVAFSDRTVSEGGKELSVYFQRLFQTFGRDRFCYLTKGNARDVGQDLDLSDFVYDRAVFSGHNFKLFSALKQWLRSDAMKAMWSKEELENIKIATHLFFCDYVKLNSFLSRKSFKSSLLICHYHNEAFIYACKKHGLPLNELQHGLIAEEDIFYVFPPQVSSVISKALFPEKIIVYGSHWKNTLLKGTEYRADSIKIGGYYQYEADVDANSEVLASYPGQKILLITTQYSAEKHFSEYVTTISPLLAPGWLICIKPHPAEKAELYKELEGFGNVKVVSGNTSEWITRSEFIVTIFSTTIFDAIRKGKIAFSLNIALYSDYTDSLTASGISHLLNLNEDPITKYNLLHQTGPSGAEFYDDFNKEAFETVLLQ